MSALGGKLDVRQAGPCRLLWAFLAGSWSVGTPRPPCHCEDRKPSCTGYLAQMQTNRKLKPQGPFSGTSEKFYKADLKPVIQGKPGHRVESLHTLLTVAQITSRISQPLCCCHLWGMWGRQGQTPQSRGKLQFFRLPCLLATHSIDVPLVCKPPPLNKLIHTKVRVTNCSSSLLRRTGMFKQNGGGGGAWGAQLSI